jgi:hypothetical protein
MNRFFKVATTMALVAFGHYQVANAAINLGNETPISESASGANFPELAAFNGVLHAAWVQYPAGATGGEIFYARSVDNGVSWSTPVNLSETPGTIDDRPQVTAGPNGVVVGWNTNNDTGVILIRRSTDAGVSFSATQQLADSGADSYSRITHLYTDSGGRVHLAYFDNGYTTPRLIAGHIRHRMSCDGGQTWGTDTAVTDQRIHGDVDNEEPRLAETGGQVYVVYRSTRYGTPQGGWAPYTVEMTRGSISGCAVTWRYPAQRLAGGLPFSFATAFRPEIVLDTGGVAHLTWWDKTAGANVRYRKGAPTQSGFGDTQVISSFGVDHLEPGGLSSTPALAAGGLQVPPAFISNGSRAFIAYQRNSQSQAGNEVGPIYVRESNDNGNTWGPETEVATGNTASTPRLTFVGTNAVVIWGDSRLGTRIYARSLTSGGAVNPNADSDNDGIPDGVEVTEGRNPAVKDNDIFGNARLFVMQQYRDFLGREGDASGVAFNASQITSGATTRTQMTSAFFSSTEFQSTVSPITRLYLGTYRRVPDTSGLLFWIGEYRKRPDGSKLQEIATAFATAPEFVNAYGNLDNTAFVNRLYELILGRGADDAGRNFWVSQLNQGVTRGVMLANFTESAEYQQVVNAEVFVISIYVGMLRRAPDQAGYDFWRNSIRAGASGDGLINAFLTSGEYRSRFLP